MKDNKETPRVKEKMIEIHESEIKSHVDGIVRQTVEETLNGLLDAEADALCGAERYERSSERRDTRAGHYRRGLQTQAGTVTLNVPKLRKLPFETAIIERYKRRESSVEEALMEMYLAGVSVRRVEDITQALWGERVSPGTISNLNHKLFERIEEWRNRPIEGRYAYVFLDGIWLKHTWGGKVEKVAVLVAVGVDEEGYREVLGLALGGREDGDSWRAFLRHLKSRGLTGVRLIVSDKCLGLVEALGEFFSDADWQRCAVHFYRNVFTAVPRGKRRQVAAMLKAIHAQEDREAAQRKACDVVEKLRGMRLCKAADTVAHGFEETLSYYAYPSQHWRSLRTNNMLERVMCEVRRRTRVVGSFPDGKSALMLVAGRLRHIASSQWGTRRYLNMQHLADEDADKWQREAVEMSACDRPVHGLASLTGSMPRPLTGLGKLAGGRSYCIRQVTSGEFSTVPQPDGGGDI